MHTLRKSVYTADTAKTDAHLISFVNVPASVLYVYYYFDCECVSGRRPICVISIIISNYSQFYLDARLIGETIENNYDGVVLLLKAGANARAYSRWAIDEAIMREHYSVCRLLKAAATKTRKNTIKV